MEVSVHNQQEKVNWHNRLEQVITRVAEQVAVGQQLTRQAEVGVILVDNLQIRQLNRQYRGKDMDTDVISFALNDEEEGVPVHPAAHWLLGDIYISLEKAAAQAAECGHSFEREVAYLTVHGLLHLLGYDHDTEQNRAEMRRMEEGILSAVNWAR